MSLTETRPGTSRATTAAPDPGFGLYVHWPFCLSKCPYCDFNSHVRESVDHGRWRAALLRELEHYAAATPGRVLTSIFFGGGTPSLMAPETARAVIARARELWTPAPGLEVTLEANPTSVEAGRLREFRAAGVGRVSLGVQAMDNASLRALGRQHSAREALAAVETAHAIFERTSFDLIYARPGQTLADWRGELSAALAHAGEHLSLYQLTIEPGTKFATLHRRGELLTPPEEAAADLYEATQAIMEEAGRPAYEISNHARPGAECRHNLTYWRYGDYVGIGPGAHGRLTLDGAKWATRQVKAPEPWLEAVERNGHATKERAAVSVDERGDEMLMMGLRLAEGVARARVVEETGRDLEDIVDPQGLARLIDGGFVSLDDTALRATEAGRQRLNGVLAMLLA